MVEQVAALQQQDEKEEDIPVETQDNAEQNIISDDGGGDELTIDGAADEEPVDDGDVKDKKFDRKAFIKIDDPAVQAKFNDIYKQTKMSDARNQMLTRLLVEQQKQLDEFKTRFNQTDHAEAARILQSRLKEARDAGNDDMADRVQQEIIDFRVDMKLHELQQKQPQNQQQQVAANPDETYVNNLANEKDNSGNYVRPWMDENDPGHERATKVAKFISDKFEVENGYRDIPEIMKRIDQVMTKSKIPQKQTQQNRTPDPFAGGNLTNRRNDHRLKLSDAEKEIARKLGLSEKDYLDNK